MIALPLVWALVTPAPESVVRAERAWAEEDYETAASAFARAYAETGEIKYLFARAEAERLADRCTDAIATYEAFIATQPIEAAMAAAEQGIATCRERLPPAAEPAPPPAVAPAPAPAPLVDVHPRPTARPWHRDPAGASLVAIGSAGVVAGIVLAVLAQTNQRAAERATFLDAYGERNDRAVLLSRAAIPVLVVGGALLLGGVIRYAVLGARQRKRSPRAYALGERLGG